jgi:hypothetical protein
MGFFDQTATPEKAPSNEGQVGPEAIAPSGAGFSLDILGEVASDIASRPAGFDPAKHAVNPDGTPKLRGDGSFALKRGRKPGQKVAGGAIVATEGATNRLSNEQAARQMFAFAYGLAAGTIGDEWLPEDKDEENTMVKGITAYFDAKGQVDLPPEIGLVIAFGAYGARRLKHQNTRDKIKLAIRYGWMQAQSLWNRLGSIRG